MQPIQMTFVDAEDHDVPFSAVEEGEWFRCGGDLVGVKQGGVGFYPNTQTRGSGNPDLPVRRLLRVHEE